MKKLRVMLVNTVENCISRVSGALFLFFSTINYRPFILAACENFLLLYLKKLIEIETF